MKNIMMRVGKFRLITATDATPENQLISVFKSAAVKWANSNDSSKVNSTRINASAYLRDSRL